MHAELPSAIDFEGFRMLARAALAQKLPPEAVHWSVAGEAAPELFAPAQHGRVVCEETLFANDAWHRAGEMVDPAVADSNASACLAPLCVKPYARDGTPDAQRVPAEFIAVCRKVALHQEPQRFARLYRMLWRLTHEPQLRCDPLDAEWVMLRLMAQAVRRDLHKMKAFVRFRSIARGAQEASLHVAWFEPEHHIVEEVAPFFVQRFANMHWAIITPLRSVYWNGTQLSFGPGGNRQLAPSADAGEALWLTYYRSIFNPARLKLRAMQKEMPRRYWQNLPEAELISELSAQAVERSGAMIERPASQPRTVARRSESGANALMGADTTQPAGTDASTVDSPDARKLLWLSQRAASVNCRECPLGAPATQTVWGEGPIGARLMLVGEQPGDQEDLRGRPFVGPSGNLLDRALAQLDWPRDRLYITNSVKHFKYRPQGKRRMHITPAQREADACQHWLESEIRLVRPQAIVALGATAARQLLGRPVAVMRERGQWFRRDDGTAVLVTLHPSALLRTEDDQREAAYGAWVQDLQRASQVVAAERQVEPEPSRQTPARAFLSNPATMGSPN